MAAIDAGEEPRHLHSTAWVNGRAALLWLLRCSARQLGSDRRAGGPAGGRATSPRRRRCPGPQSPYGSPAVGVSTVVDVEHVDGAVAVVDAVADPVLTSSCSPLLGERCP